jgi:hypothetical protein
MSDKIYAPFFLKEIKTKYGSLLKLSFNAEKLLPFIEEHKNEKGYVNININQRQEVGQFGDTHYATLDTWKPEGDYIPKDKPVTDFLKDEDPDGDLPF